MTEPGALTPGTLLNLDVTTQVIDEPVDRVRSWLVYAVLRRGRRHTLFEYAPAGVVARNADEGLRPARDDAKLAHEWRKALDRVEALGGKLLAIGSRPGIEQIVHVERAGGTVYLVAENASGRSPLAARFGGAAMAPTEVRDLALGLAAAMAAAHDADLLHHDIAAETVTVGDNGAVALRCFSIDERPFMRLIGDKAPFVRPPYSPLELYDDSGRQVITPASDIYSASALLYRLVTGRDAPAATERFQAGASDIRPQGDGFSEGFLDAITRGLATDPAKAFLSVEEWRAAIEPILAPSAAVVKPSGGRTPVGLIAALLLLLGLAGAAGFAWYIGEFDQSDIAKPTENTLAPWDNAIVPVPGNNAEEPVNGTDNTIINSDEIAPDNGAEPTQDSGVLSPGDETLAPPATPARRRDRQGQERRDPGVRPAPPVHEQAKPKGPVPRPVLPTPRPPSPPSKPKPAGGLVTGCTQGSGMPGCP